ncbi:MAG TPA: carbamoyltransferase HypF [Blastocatellia bacterium]|nr:carbamoyltransferase HypF [Blastocatellia bacterium]
MRLRISIRGAVQGVGFRPFIYRLASEARLAGWVSNSTRGVIAEVEGSKDKLQAFLLRVDREKPPRSFIQSLEASFLDPIGYTKFEIRGSDDSGAKSAIVLPDIATCADCLQEIRDPSNRRYGYPFTNCTNCGPRFTIIDALPYDRPNTTMKRFEMCADCRAEYNNPLNRRFHAQPNACPACGPHIDLLAGDGTMLASRHDALLKAAEAIVSGSIVAVKGLGGFHLMVDARNDAAVRRLRERKHREEKPLALMYPSVEAIKSDCEISELEERLLLSPESPIVLLRRKSASGTVQSPPSTLIAPGNPYLGVMLPYTPLHQLLMGEMGFPIVATSGNLSDEPICTDEHQALDRLKGIADFYLVHDRPIARHVDDSIVRVMMGRELVLRRARGYAPLPVQLTQEAAPALAVGAHLKNAIAGSTGDDVFISQHIGDLETPEAFDAFERVIHSFTQLYELQLSTVACDEHPDYLSTRFAKQHGSPVLTVQHHYAHVLSCMAENRLQESVLGVSWDGTGYGLDGTVWGGEFLQVPGMPPDAEDDPAPFQRLAHLRRFRLPGGEKAIKEPRRAAIGLLYELFGDAVFEMEELAPVRAFSPEQRELLRGMLEKKLNAPATSSAGRLFDAIASIAGLRQKVNFEGQAAMELEFALDGVTTDDAYPVTLSHCRFEKDQSAGGSHSAVIVDWAPMVRGILSDARSGIPIGNLSAKFHNTLVDAIAAVALRVGEERVVLTGGCFQNKYLTERAVGRLEREGFRVYWHQRVPPNDGGIALGQIMAASREYWSRHSQPRQTSHAASQRLGGPDWYKR